MSGAFLTSREIFDNPIWQNIVCFRLFFLIYGRAVYSEDGMRIGNVILKRGQWVRSIRNLVRDLEYIENRSVKRYSESVVHRAIKALEKDGRIKTEPCELGTLFTVANYEEYQGFASYRKPNVEQQQNGDGTGMEQPKNNGGTTEEQQRNNNKKENKENKEINKNPIVEGDDEIPFAEILGYLSDQASRPRGYSPSSKSHRKWIRARWRDGYRMDDFKRVVDNKCAAWKGHPDHDKYLRPETLFGEKFDSYLNERTESERANGKGSRLEDDFDD